MFYSLYRNGSPEHGSPLTWTCRYCLPENPSPEHLFLTIYRYFFCQSKKTNCPPLRHALKKNYQVLKGLRGFSVQVQESHPRKGIYEVRSGKRFAPIAGTSPQKCYTGRVRVVFGDVFRPVYARGLAGRQGIRYQPHYATRCTMLLIRQSFLLPE